MKILMRSAFLYFLSCFALFSLSFAVKLSNLLPLSCLKSGAQWG